MIDNTPKYDPLLMYHGNCPDGFGAKYAFWKKFGYSMEYLPMSHGDRPPDCTGRTVYIADFSFDEETILEIAGAAYSIVVLDHHVSAFRNIGHLDFCQFDMEQSGAVLSWKYCFPDKEVPILLRYVEDRDLWNFKLPFSEEILAAVDSYDRTFEAWSELDRKLNDPLVFGELIKKGHAILKYNQILMGRLKKDVHTLVIRDQEVPAINTPFFRSEIVTDLAKNASFAAGYHYDGNKFVFSLRSANDDVDVSVIAATFPGGEGHAKAAGFSVKTLKELNG